MCHHYWPVEGSTRFSDFEVKQFDFFFILSWNSIG